MQKISGFASYGVVTGSIIGLALTTAVPAAAQKLPNRLHGPARIDNAPNPNPRGKTIGQHVPRKSTPDAAARGGAVGGPVIEDPVRSMAPGVALPTPSQQAPLPTKRASNAPVLGTPRKRHPSTQDRVAPAREEDTAAAAPTVARRAQNNDPAHLGAPESGPAATVDANRRSTLPPTTLGTPDEARQTTGHSDDRLAQLRKEQFRRRAAETAQKEIEQMADQLREQLGREIEARRKAEGVAAELVSRASLEDQIDQERARLRSEKIRTLEKRRKSLEVEVTSLTLRLANERNRRRQLEAEKAALAKSLAAAQRAATSGVDVGALQSKVRELERKLNAAEWARKLAEAQLRVMTGKTDAKPATGPGGSN